LSIKAENTFIIEDVVTTGGQILLSAEELRKLGAKLENILCVIERNPDARKKLKEAGLELISLFTMEDLKKYV
jgi:orotate phosphoribosyltransferase